MPTFPEQLRPDKCRVLWQMTEDGTTAVATPDYPGRMASREQRDLVRRFNAAGVQVRINR
jgi:hypothetical protein